MCAIILPGKLIPGDVRRELALQHGFKEQTVWLRPEDGTKEQAESALFKLRPYRFFVHVSEGKLPTSVVLNASEQCASELLQVGFEAGQALVKWFGVDKIPDALQDVSIRASYWGMEIE